MKLDKPIATNRGGGINSRPHKYPVPPDITRFLEMYPYPYCCFTCGEFSNPVCLRFEQVPPYEWASKCGVCKYWIGDDGIPF